MNPRGLAYLGYAALRGSKVPRYYREYLEADASGPAPETSRLLLSLLLRHCRENVPHYADLMRALPDPAGNPVAVLERLPVLTKAVIRARFDQLKSRDLARRRWFVNTSGGSTGEPATFVQDAESACRTEALSLAYSRWAGHELGEPNVVLWGSEREVARGTERWGARAANALTRTRFLNAFRMTPDAMRRFAAVIRKHRPNLVLAYAQSLDDFAKFVEAERIELPPVRSVITSANTLQASMRARFRRVFRGAVYDRYGSREVGLIAGERPGVQGLWVPPWNVWLEVVDEDGGPVPPGMDGEILVTSLVNYAMPLVRYRIGDRGALSADDVHGGRVLLRLLGRSVDAFRRRDGTVVYGGFFTAQVYFRDWVDKFQFVQTGYDEVVLRVVSAVRDRSTLRGEIEEIAAHVRIALGPEARLRVEWVDDIAPGASGKFRYVISELAAR